MKVKKYAAPTMPEVMKQIRNELGSEAVILNSRKVKRSGGFMGLKKKSLVEVVAALDPVPKPLNQGTKLMETNDPLSEYKRTSDSAAHVLNEIQVLKKLIHQSTMNKSKYPAIYQSIYMYLLEQETDETVACRILDQVVSFHESENIEPTRERVKQDVKKEIMIQLEALSYKPISSEQKVVHFVGPTGVGKTTTIAKIAAKSVLKEGKRVAFITADTYRIAAVEQLKTYARILNVPVEVVYTKEDYINAVKKLEDYDFILVDTAGRNFREEIYINELSDSIESDITIDIYLVLSLTSKAKDLMEIYEQFRYLPINQVILTKIDETRQYGSMLNLALEKKTGIAYITNGQDVPDDLMEATPELIANYCTGGSYHA